MRSLFSLSSVFIMFSFKFLRFEEHFRKAPFLSRISLDGNKLRPAFTRPERRLSVPISSFLHSHHLTCCASGRKTLRVTNLIKIVAKNLLV